MNATHPENEDDYTPNKGSGTGMWLWEEGTGKPYGPASQEDADAYTAALQSGKTSISKGHHGYSLKFTVGKKNN